MSDEQVPTDRRYTAEHEWVLRTGDTTARVGITDFAQAQLGDVVFVQLPDVGSEHAAGTAIGEIESTKSVSDVFTPLTGTVSARNDALDEDTAVVNTDPYGAGWLVDLDVATAADLDEALAAMLDADGYRALTSGD
ncbi:glycine cleavage system protein GcvH [Rhodococcus sp. X156]|uniref:glycine cleavage system protein GcvH n=1 Tax=Rhodococcus sp. X156 TaxID=2499145 RepID=UPI000FD88A77|nr:glycine cleavage system protein GcvH [Rhodococcus sp. X156]